MIAKEGREVTERQGNDGHWYLFFHFGIIFNDGHCHCHWNYWAMMDIGIFASASKL